MEFNDINSIIERYFDGVSSQEDEQTLVRYFDQQRELSEEHRVAKVMFESFALLHKATMPDRSITERSKSYITIRWRAFGRVASAVAVICGIALLATLALTKQQQPTTTDDLICYVDGVRIEDQMVARAEADRILDKTSSNIELAMHKVAHITKISTSDKQ